MTQRLFCFVIFFFFLEITLEFEARASVQRRARAKPLVKKFDVIQPQKVKVLSAKSFFQFRNIFSNVQISLNRFQLSGFLR